CQSPGQLHQSISTAVPVDPPRDLWQLVWGGEGVAGFLPALDEWPQRLDLLAREAVQKNVTGDDLPAGARSQPGDVQLRLVHEPAGKDLAGVPGRWPCELSRVQGAVHCAA